MQRRQIQQPKESGALVFMVIALVAAGGIGFFAMSSRRADTEPRKEFNASDLRAREAEYQAKRSEKEAELEQKYKDDRQAEFKKQEYLERAQRLNPNPVK